MFDKNHLVPPPQTHNQHKQIISDHVSQRKSQKIIITEPPVNTLQVPSFHTTPQPFWFGTSIDPRDNKILLEQKSLLPIITDQFTEASQLKLRSWLVDVFEAVISDTFNRYLKKQFNEEQLKAYASKNILLNIQHFMKQIPESEINKRQKLFRFINEQSKQIIKAVILKYPQSDNNSGSRKLKKTIFRPDNRQSDEFDLLRFTSQKFSFQYNITADYSSSIMKALNYIMQFANSPFVQGLQQETNFDGFHSVFENIFTFSGFKQFEDGIINIMNKKVNLITSSLPLQKKIQDIFASIDAKNPYLINNYKNRILQDCKFKINQKIPNSTLLYNNQEIQSGLFKIPEVSLLRVMTKWAQQLRDKLQNAKTLIYERVQFFKTKTGDLLNLHQNIKYCLYEAAKKQQQRISQIIKKLKEENLKVGSELLQNQFHSLYSNNIDANIGIAAARSQSCVGRYIFTYLNELIHSLLTIPIRAKQLYMALPKATIQKANQIQEINLISFKIGDLVRAKCQSNEKHIIDIYKLFEKISQQSPLILKIIRVKDRLGSKDNDVLINLFFMNKFQVQVQLSVHSLVDQKKQKFNSFNHFLYQLKRSQFGVIAQCTCLCARYDPVIKYYSQLQNLAPKTISINQKVKRQKKQRQHFIQTKKEKLNNIPFFCSKCGQFNKNLNPNFYKRIHCQEYKECNNCYEEYMIKQNPYSFVQQLISQRFSDSDLFQDISCHFQVMNFVKGKQIDQLKQLSRCFIVKKNYKKSQPQYAEIVSFKSTIYVVGVEKRNGARCTILLKLNKKDTELKKQLSSLIFLKPQKIFFNNPEDNNGKLLMFAEQNNLLLMELEVNIFSRQETVYTSNLQYIKQIQKEQKQVFFISKREITNQLENMKMFRKVKRFYGFCNKIQNVRFLSKLPCLEQLNLNSNSLSSLQGIQSSRNLIFLKCCSNNLKTFEEVTKLLKIQRLQLRQNNLTKIQNLTCLQNLRQLRLGGNKICKIQGLSKLQYLQSLQLSSNLIKKIQCIKSKALKYLQLNENRIQNIQNLESLSSLLYLDLSSNNIKQLKNIGIPSLHTLHLNCNNIQRIQNLKELANLKTLSLNGNKISLIQKLQKQVNLQVLSLNGNKIKSISGLENVIQLKKLNISENQIVKIDGLQKLQKLKFLQISGNKIAQIQNLQMLTELETLQLRKNKIGKIKNLDTLKLLKKLDLGSNCINKIQNLGFLYSLNTLNLENNKIKFIQNLQLLESLHILYLSYNQIKDIKNLTTLHNIKKVQLYGNPIQKNTKQTRIASLLEKRKTAMQITYLEKPEDQNK